MRGEEEEREADCCFRGFPAEHHSDGGYVCPSDIFYGRPKRGENTFGEWKVIVNLPDSYYGSHYQKYTQTTRYHPHQHHHHHHLDIISSSGWSSVSTPRPPARSSARVTGQAVFRNTILCDCWPTLLTRQGQPAPVQPCLTVIFPPAGSSYRQLQTAGGLQLSCQPGPGNSKVAHTLAQSHTQSFSG